MDAQTFRQGWEEWRKPGLRMAFTLITAIAIGWWTIVERVEGTKHQSTQTALAERAFATGAQTLKATPTEIAAMLRAARDIEVFKRGEGGSIYENRREAAAHIDALVETLRTAAQLVRDGVEPNNDDRAVYAKRREDARAALQVLYKQADDTRLDAVVVGLLCALIAGGCALVLARQLI